MDILKMFGIQIMVLLGLELLTMQVGVEGVGMMY